MHEDWIRHRNLLTLGKVPGLGDMVSVLRRRKKERTVLLVPYSDGDIGLGLHVYRKRNEENAFIDDA